MKTIQSKLTDERGTVFWAVLTVLLVASLLLTSVVLYGAWHQSQNRRFLHQTQARYLAQAALANARAQLESDNQTDSIVGFSIHDSLPDGGHWSATASPWGFYLSALCSGVSHQSGHTIDVLFGHDPSPEFDYALRMFGPPYPLVVAGHTRIVGDVNVGPGGVSSGQYHGRDRSDTTLVNGAVVTDPPPRPIPFNCQVWSAFADRLVQLRADIPIRADRTLIIDDNWKLNPHESVIVIDASVTFARSRPMESNRPLVIVASGPVIVGGKTSIDGRWCIRSDQVITVEAEASLAGVVLWAPRIEIKGNARFSGQAIADTLLEIADQAQTRFPTLLWVTGESSKSSAHIFRLTSSKWCEGIVGLSAIREPWEWMDGPEMSGEVLIDSLARWRGYLYVNGKAEIRGTVAGSVNAGLLIVKDPTTTYLNWLLDARVSRQAWMGFTALPAIMNSENEWEVAEYLELHSRSQDRSTLLEAEAF